MAAWVPLDEVARPADRRARRDGARAPGSDRACASRIEIDVDAPGERVFDLARDVDRWPELLPHYRKVTVLSRTDGAVAARCARSGPSVRLASRSAWRRGPGPTPPTRTTCGCASSTLAARRAGWTSPGTSRRAASSGSHVAIEHEFVAPLPLLGTELFPRGRRSTLRPADRRSDAGDVQATRRERAERVSRRRSGDRAAAASGSRHRPGHADRHRPRRVLGRPARRALAGQAHRSLRSNRSSARRWPPRSTTSSRPTTWTPRRRARPTASASSRWPRAGWRSTMRG